MPRYVPYNPPAPRLTFKDLPVGAGFTKPGSEYVWVKISDISAHLMGGMTPSSIFRPDDLIDRAFDIVIEDGQPRFAPLLGFEEPKAKPLTQHTVPVGAIYQLEDGSGKLWWTKINDTQVQAISPRPDITNVTPTNSLTVKNVLVPSSDC